METCYCNRAPCVCPSPVPCSICGTPLYEDDILWLNSDGQLGKFGLGIKRAHHPRRGLQGGQDQ